MEKKIEVKLDKKLELPLDNNNNNKKLVSIIRNNFTKKIPNNAIHYLVLCLPYEEPNNDLMAATYPNKSSGKREFGSEMFQDAMLGIQGRSTENNNNKSKIKRNQKKDNAL